ncbi:MAG: hypothetical protein HOK30_14890 [Rhodospirillaceae bacterium]|jgi:hypothetical protein|nr:hypothetical protein [Rhodospirillaceae bacterium]MBT5896203.1 hypothetical protein [Rhodospirillaceae bacterium]MBT6428952.1 hypothetical protein [Rhodospirillaceae bacterium]
MVIEFVLGAAIVILATAALMVWLSNMTRGLPAMIMVAGVMTLAVLVLMAHTAMGVSLVEALHLLLVIALIAAPVIAIALAQLRRAS